MRLLLDTSFCLYLITEKPSSLAAALAPFAPGDLGVSSITVAALQAQVQASADPLRNGQALAQFLLPLEVADFDSECAHILGRISARWAETAPTANTHALLLAAHTLRLDAGVVTRRPEQYPALPGLHINPEAAQSLLQPLPPTPAPMHHLLSAALDVGTDQGHTIVVMGSHDLTLDLLTDTLHAAHPELTMVSAQVGSLAGLAALRRNQAHVAGAHLFDPESGEFNTAHIRRILTPHGCRVMVVGFVTRTQGLLTAPGNSKQIRDLPDLLRAGVRFVNRQPGAGTRLLLDYELDRRGLNTRQIQGYATTESSHSAVAQAVADGRADCGLGIQAAAQAHQLDFVPLYQERYDLVIPVTHYHSALLAPLLALLQNPPAAFLDRVHALGGYGTDGMGAVLAEI